MRRILSLVVAVSIFLSLAAMGGGALAEEEAPPEGQPVEEVTPEPTVITFWSMWNADEYRASLLLTAAELYEMESGVHVNIEFRGRDLSGYIGDSLAAGEGVDIFEDNYMNICTGGYKNFTLGLNQMAADAGYDGHSYAVFNDQVKSSAGRLNCVTELPQVGAIFYDKDAFKAAGITGEPETWEEFLDACAKLKDVGYGPLALDSNFTHFLFYHQLVRYLGEDGVTALRDEGHWADNDGAVQAAQDMIDLTKAGYLVFGAPEEYPNSQNKIGYGLAAMTLNYDSVVSEVESATGVKNINWGAFTYPEVEGGVNDGATYVDATSLAISSYSAHPQEAFDFIMYLVTGKYDQDVSSQYDLIPADTGNTAPGNRAEAKEILEDVSMPMTQFGQLWYMPGWDAAAGMITGLFTGAYASGADFCAAIDSLYPVPELEAPPAEG